MLLSSKITSDHLASLGRAKLPALRELTLIHSGDWGSNDAGLFGELAGAFFPKLEALTVCWRGPPPTPETWKPLLATPLVRRLKVLELAFDYGAPALRFFTSEATALTHLVLRLSWPEKHLKALRRSGSKVEAASSAWPPPECVVELPKEPEPEEGEEAYDDHSYGEDDEGDYDVVQRYVEDGPSNDALDRPTTDNSLPPLYDETGGKDDK
ncbi:MAG: hypothetical protein QM765_37990 [Myxococcales bacterium]